MNGFREGVGVFLLLLLLFPFPSRELFCEEGCVREDGEKPGAAFFLFRSKLKDGLPRALADEKAMTKANLRLRGLFWSGRLRRARLSFVWNVLCVLVVVGSSMARGVVSSLIC